MTKLLVFEFPSTGPFGADAEAAYKGTNAGKEWAATRTWSMAAASFQRIYESLLERND